MRIKQDGNGNLLHLKEFKNYRAGSFELLTDGAMCNQTDFVRFLLLTVESLHLQFAFSFCIWTCYLS